MFSYRVDEDIELKILQLRYAEELFQIVDINREYLAHWLPWVEGSKSVEDTKSYISSELNRFAKNNGFSSGIFYKNRLVGCIGIHDISWDHKKTSIGYWLNEQNQGIGIMTLSCRSIIDYAFNTLDLNRIEIRACKENLKSRAIPERLGFKNEGTIREEELLNNKFYDHVVYGMLAKEWKNELM